VLTVGVLAFAFLAASFTARNSDLWLHLASGRLLAQGNATFGVDPFAWTTEGAYWVNHAWLSDLLLYAGFQTLGGAGLVAVKAGVVAVLAWVLLRIGQTDRFALTAGCTLLALLTMSPRLLLQPATLSLLLLAVCLGLLQFGGRALYLLPTVIALWVNLDSWFLLGPLLVGLYALGQRLDANRPQLPLWVLPACIAACLVNPYHVHALLTLPAELSPAVCSSDLRHDVRFAPLFQSPWRLAPLGEAGGYNLSAWAYFALLALGAASFAMRSSALRSWRAPVWLAFCLLGAWQVRLVPFFAVVAAPITALNLGEAAPHRKGSRFVEVGVLLGNAVLLVLCWPGWLQGFHGLDRPVAWGIHLDPSLQRVVGTLQRWRREGALPAGTRTFANHPDVAHYLAWFFPEEKSFLDSRLPLFAPVIGDYERLCLAINPTLRDDAASSSGWQQVLRDQRIACLVVYDPDLRRLAPALRQVVQTSTWDLLRVDGQAVIVAAKGELPSLRFEAQRLAFSRTDEEALPPAPGEGPPHLDTARPWWGLMPASLSGSSWEAPAAAVYLRLFDDSAADHLRQQRVPVLARHAAGLAALPALPAGTAATAVAVAGRLTLGDFFLPDLFERPPALPLLAVRAARRAVAAHPQDAAAWLVLAQAYLALARTTPEASRHAHLALLARVRTIQTVTALTQAVSIRPDLAIAHEALGDLFAEVEFLDLALRHRKTNLDLVRRAGRRPGEDEAAFQGRLQHLEQGIERIERVVQDNENRYFIGTQKLAADPLARMQLARKLGLAGRALDVLLRSSPDLYGIEGLQHLLDLLLHSGRAQDARDLLDREELRRNPAGLLSYALVGGTEAGKRWSYTFGAYEWFDFCQAAAAGNYDRAALTLTSIRSSMKLSEDRFLAGQRAALARQLAAEVGTATIPGAIALQASLRVRRDQVQAAVVPVLFLPVERADLCAVEGMLLLEQGHPDRAREQFLRAMSLYRGAPPGVPALAGQPLTLTYLRLIPRLDGKVPSHDRAIR
jgi:hypothetical protein